MSDCVKNLQKNALLKHFKTREHIFGLTKLMESSEVVKLITDSYADKHVDGGYISMDNVVTRRQGVDLCVL